MPSITARKGVDQMERCEVCNVVAKVTYPMEDESYCIKHYEQLPADEEKPKDKEKDDVYRLS